MALRTSILIVILALFGGFSHELKAKRSHPQPMPDLGGIPESLDGWYSQDYPLTDEVSEVLAADVTLYRRYWNTAGSEIWLFVAYFAEQTVNSQIHSPRHCVPGGGWDIVSIDPTNVSVGDESWAATRMIIRREHQSQEMLYWFRTRGGVVSGEYALKWDLVKNSLARKGTDAAFVRFSASEADVEAMQGMIGMLHPFISEALSPVEAR